MLLNSKIICDNLKELVSIKTFGQNSHELTLRRPQFYESGEFASNHLYIALYDRLPSDPIFGQNVLVIVIGGTPSISFLTGNCTCLVVQDRLADLFSVFNFIQQTFDKFDYWDERLQEILQTTGSVSDLLVASIPIFKNSLTVMDENMRILSATNVASEKRSLQQRSIDPNNRVSSEMASEFLRNYGDDVSDASPYLLNFQDYTCLITKIFEETGRHCGAISLSNTSQELRESDADILLYLAKAVRTALMGRDIQANDNQKLMMKSALGNLLAGLPLKAGDLWRFEDRNGNFVCIEIKPGSGWNKMSKDYLCYLFEEAVRDSIAFKEKASVVAVIDLNKNKTDENSLATLLNAVAKQLDICIGVSYSFSDLSMIRYYYKQASIAYEIGSLVDPGSGCHLFDTFMLDYILSLSIQEFPPESIMSKGIRRLLRHDLTSQVNYISTLRTYLDNNANIAKSAKDLFIHRSTFLERIKRIETLLEVDFNDPNQRMQLHISLKILDVYDKLKN
jgi:hypothetical protein